MGFRFRKSFRVMPGVRLNVSKGGVSTSLGGKGFTANLSKRGVRGTVGLPGTGLSYSRMLSQPERATASTSRARDVEAAFHDTPRSEEYLPVTQNSAITTTIAVVGLIVPVVLASIAAGSFISWLGWLIALVLFGFGMLSLGRASTDIC